jgi:hypothetical protein
VVGKIFSRNDSIDPRGESRFGHESAQGRLPLRRILPEHIQDLSLIISKPWTFDADTGTVPFTVSSGLTSIIPNLNAQMVGGVLIADILSNTGTEINANVVPVVTGTGHAMGPSPFGYESDVAFVSSAGASVTHFQIDVRNLSENSQFLEAGLATNVDHYIQLATAFGFMGWKASQGLDFYTPAASGFDMRFRPNAIADPVIFTSTGISWGGGAEIASSDDVLADASAYGALADPNTWTALQTFTHTTAATIRILLNAPDATAIKTLQDSMKLQFLAEYWDGATSASTSGFTINDNATAAPAGTHQLDIDSGTYVWSFKDTGDTVFPLGILPDADSVNLVGGSGAVWAEGWFDAIKSDGTITIVPVNEVVINMDGGSFQTPEASVGLLVVNSSVVGDGVAASLVCGTAGIGYLNFGDTADENAGYIAYDHNVNAMTFRTNGSGVDLTLSSGGVLTHVADILPGSDSALDLGSTGAVYAEVWTDAIKSDGELTITPTVVIGTAPADPGYGDYNLRVEDSLVVGTPASGGIEMGTWPVSATYGMIGHRNLDQSVAGNYTFTISNSGDLYLNTPSSKTINVRINNSTYAQFTGTGLLVNTIDDYTGGAGVTIEGTQFIANDINPSADSVDIIGKTGAAWAQVWTDTIHSDGTLTLFGGASGVTMLWGTTPNLIHYESDGAVDYKVWEVYGSGGVLVHRVFSDAFGAGDIWMQVERTTTTVDAVRFPNGIVDVYDQLNVRATTYCDTFAEYTGGAGITLDGVLLKDSGITATAPITVSSAANAYIALVDSDYGSNPTTYRLWNTGGIFYNKALSGTTEGTWYWRTNNNTDVLRLSQGAFTWNDGSTNRGQVACVVVSTSDPSGDYPEGTIWCKVSA